MLLLLLLVSLLAGSALLTLDERGVSSSTSTSSETRTTATKLQQIGTGSLASAISKDTNLMSSNSGRLPLKDALMRELIVESDATRGYVLGVRGAALLAAFPAFEAAGSYGNGPAWAALAEYLLATSPTLTGVHLDDQSDAFLAYANEEATLQKLRAQLIDTVSNDSKLRAAVAAARERGFGEGDL